MARTRPGNRNTRALGRLQEAGIGACAVGVALLLLPQFAGKSPALAAVATGLGSVGWVALALGVVFLVVHRLTKATQLKSEASGGPAGSAVTRGRRQRKGKNAGGARMEPQWSDGAAPGAWDAQALAAAGGAAGLKRPTAWSAEVFAQIEWRRFEAVCETLFAQAGFETLSESHGADGGVDIWLHSRNAQGPVAVVQCKHWQGKAVGVKEMREFFGVMASHQLRRGTYATTSTYTPDARQFAKANGINALDGADLLMLIAARAPEQQQALLRVAFDGEYWRPTCASCGTKMVERTPSNGGARFWGCSNYPRCKLRLPMVTNLQQLSQLMQ